MYIEEIEKRIKGKDPESIKHFLSALVYEIVDENYGGVIDNLTIDYINLSIPKIKGTFYSPRLNNKRLKIIFDIDKENIILKPQNLEVIDEELEKRYYLGLMLSLNSVEKINYFPTEFFNFAQKQMNCVTGWSCKGENGYACLSKTKKNCNNKLNERHFAYLEWISNTKTDSSDLMTELENYVASKVKPVQTPKTNNPQTPTKQVVSNKGGDKNTVPQPQSLPKTSQKNQISHTKLINAGKIFAKKYITEDFQKTKEEEEKYQIAFSLANKINGKLANEEDVSEEEMETYIKNKNEYYVLNKERMEKAHKNMSKLKNYVKMYHKKKNPEIAEEKQDWINRLNIGKKVKGEMLDRTLKTLGDFFDITGGKGSQSIKNIDYTFDRAYASSDDKLINTGKEAKERDIQHEAAHHVEYESKSLRDAAYDFIISRATSSKPKKLKDITGNKNYRDDEIAMEDKFVTPYVGKIYGKKGAPTEVISMGIERFATPELMAKFYLKDEEHFYFTLGALLYKNENYTRS